MSKRKKTNAAPPDLAHEDNGSVTTRATVPDEVLAKARGEGPSEETAEHEEHAEPEENPAASTTGKKKKRSRVGVAAPSSEAAPPSEPAPEESLDLLEALEQGEIVEEPVDSEAFDSEQTVNLVGELPLPGRDDLDEPTVSASGEALEEVDRALLQRKHLRGLVEALVFASDAPIKPNELAKLASAPQKVVKELLAELRQDYSTRGMHLDEVAGGWVFRTSPQYAPFVRDLTKQKPVRLTRAQVETLAIIAYRQPMTRPEIDDVRGVDSGPVLKLLLERDLVRILGKRDEPGRPLIYGTTTHFLEFFGLRSLKDLPTLREFTELSDESRATYEDELGEPPTDAERMAAEAEARVAAVEGSADGESMSGNEDAGTHADHGGLEGELGEQEHDAPRESMRIPISEQALEDFDSEDLETLDPIDEELRGLDPSEAPHPSDLDDKTLTSEAPPAPEDDEA